MKKNQEYFVQKILISNAIHTTIICLLVIHISLVPKDFNFFIQ